LHLIIDPSEDMRVMQEEIFGPILILRSYQNIEDCIAYVNKGDHPLALYYYGKDKKEQDKVIASTLSGGVTVNDAIFHAGIDGIPFGGIGASGMGHYHGFEGFKTFSHAKSVFYQGRISPAKLLGLIPPFKNKNSVEKRISLLMNKQ